MRWAVDEGSNILGGGSSLMIKFNWQLDRYACGTLNVQTFMESILLIDFACGTLVKAEVFFSTLNNRRMDEKRDIDSGDDRIRLPQKLDRNDACQVYANKRTAGKSICTSI